MNGFERRKQKKIEQIYSIAFRLFSERGFQKVSVNEIAQQAGVSPATIYNYFGTKEQLYVDMLMNWMDKQLERYDCILDSALSFPEKTKEIMLLEAQNLKLLSYEFLNVPSSESTGLAERMERDSGEKVMRFFMKFVAMGKQEGYIHREQTEEVAIRYFTMFKNELGRYWQAGDQEGLTQSMDQFIELFFYGLIGQAKKQK
ncbi:TetR/AcrR family transcriptional regulator [Paenibacillus alvei]|uniref:TetR/AcrR family transcriptional regulator n=1 Tax=Paenibacillus alvei TaxID=44250 RepID=A0ABT4H4M0_PAEAL|nr:TetR/AcrR family transcriptional regulator [Paenibacillus alvei]MCY9763937.1 TetR/AcrR family transcriptional regulator [Paenibacillus alvei]MCY9767020.1 TetR/AcrR family transcriptional regulator [Paenibacillus alvei]